MTAELTVSLPDYRENKIYYFHETLFRRVLTPALKNTFRLFTKLTADGVENLPAKGPVILAANHLTNYDVFPMQFVLPRPIFYMGKEELFRNPILDWSLRQLGGFPVYRGEKDTWAFQHAQRVLERGQVLGIFPEGSRSNGKGLQRGKTGAARLALAADCPLVPMVVDGPQYMFKRFPRRTRINILLGEPLYPQSDESTQALTDRLMFTLAAMLPPEARGVYHRSVEDTAR